MREYEETFVTVIRNKSGTFLYRIGSVSTSMSTAWFLESEIDELQQEIANAKAFIYEQKRKEKTNASLSQLSGERE
jgi:hypothetical protein